MSKIAKLLKITGLIIKKPWLLNLVLQEPGTWKETVINKYGLENGLPVINPEKLFGEDPGAELNVFTFLDGGSLVTDIALLKNLARDIKDCNYFEIGTWRGESVVNVAEVAKTCYTLNLSEAELRSMHVDERIIEQQGFFSRGLKNVTHLTGNSSSFDFASLNRKFDLIFIDGDHHYDFVKEDTKKIFKYLTHPGSIIVWHDYGVTPEHIRFEVLAGILDGTPKELHKYLYHVSNTKSAIMIRKDLPGEVLVEPVKPTFYYKVKINYIKPSKR